MKKTFRIILMIGFVWIVMNAFSFVNAATATISANKTSATVGDSVKVTVTVNAAAWNIKVSGSASDNVVGYNGDGENQKTIKTYIIDTSKEGTYKVSINGDITDASEELENISNSVSIKVQAKTTTSNSNSDIDTSSKKTTTKSSNANLSTLGVTPKQYDFSGFSKNKTEYSVTVPNDVDSLKVSYKTADSKASVKISGNTNLEVGSNKIEVVVTAEDGKTTKTYTINVTKLATEDDKPGNVIENDEEIYLKELSLDGVEISPEFKKDVYSYTANLDKLEEKNITVKAIANNEDANIEISGNEELVEGENIINVLLTLDGTSQQKIYQITLNIEKLNTINEQENLQENVQDSGVINDLMGNIKKYVIIAIVVVAFIIVLVIILLILIKKEKNNEEYEDEEEKQEYDVYESDNNEFEELQGQSVEYKNGEIENNITIEKNKKRERGKHSK